ncbi:MAG TPA: EAL domain-containing protein [Dehalococcoidia bacterium]|nr:EAL domain-containing protein [Dehalococcoidia bacterium]
MTSLGLLRQISAVAGAGAGSPAAGLEALRRLRDALGAARATIVYAGQDGFERLGDDPELSDTAIWIVNRDLTGRSGAAAFSVRDGRVADFAALEPGRPTEAAGFLLPVHAARGEMLLLRGPWPRGLDEAAITVAEAGCAALALWLDRYRDVWTAHREQEQLSAFVDVSRVVSQDEDLETMLGSIARMIATVTGIDYVSIDILDDAGGVALRCVNYATDTVRQTDRWKRGLSRPDPVRSEVVATQQPLLFADAQTDERIPEPGRRFFIQNLIRSTAVFPLVAKHESLGVISFASYRHRTFVEEQPLLEGLASQVAGAVLSMRLYDERQRAQTALRRGEELLRATLESTADGILVVGTDGETVFHNERFARMWRIPAQILEAGDDGPMLAFVLDQLEDPEEFLSRVHMLYQTTDESMDTLAFKDGRVFERYSRPLGAAGGSSGRVWSFRDVTAERRAEAALRQSEERFRSLVQNASDLITVVDADTTILYQSPAIEHVLGHDSEALVGTRLALLMHPDDIAPVATFLEQLPAPGTTPSPVEARLRHRDGTWHAVEIVGTDQRRDPAVRGLVLNIRDISERMALETQLRYQAFHDPLTRLANRTRFSERLEHALQRSRRSKALLAVLFIDLDNFKSVNDGLGHAAGDRLLVEIGRRIRDCLREHDTAARFGGDEFAILAEGVTGADDARAVARRIFDGLEVPFDLGGRELFVRASIGVALNSGGDEDVGRMMRNADVAMYAAKERGKGRCEVYQASMDRSMLERLELLGDLQRAVERGEFVVHYQPTVRLDTGEIVGAEALVRWNHPQRGLLPPAQFIPLAEESGVILPLGRWVMREACETMRRWQGLYPRAPRMKVGINVSVRQMQEPGFTDEVAATISRSGIDPADVVLEITESVMLEDIEAMVEVLDQLKRIGVQLAIDDFGTGYSSLSYLRQFPFDVLKIDKSFVDSDDDDHHKDLSQAIIELGRTLNMEIVAEGVETAEQARRLHSLGCRVGQGFLFARPMAADDVESLIATSTRAHAA